MKTRTSLGMFDFLKGFTMLLIVLYHTTELYSYPVGSTMYKIQYIFDNTIQQGVNAAFFIVGGYALRKRPVGKMISSQLKSIARPFVITGIVRAIALFALHFLFFRTLYYAAKEALSSLIGYALEPYASFSFHGFTFYSCGPMWFLVSMASGLILLNAILNWVPERFVLPVVLAVYFSGILLFCCTNVIPFSFLMAYKSCLYCYIGYCLKRRKILQQNNRNYRIAFLFASLALIIFFVVHKSGVFNEVDAQHDIIYNLVFDVVEMSWGIVICVLFVNINSEKSKIINLFCVIGRYSLYVLCVHTVELMAIPWYLLSSHFSARPFTGICIQFLLHWVIIAAGSYGLYLLNHIPEKYRSKFKLLFQQ